MLLICENSNEERFTAVDMTRFQPGRQHQSQTIHGYLLDGDYMSECEVTIESMPSDNQYWAGHSKYPGEFRVHILSSQFRGIDCGSRSDLAFRDASQIPKIVWLSPLSDTYLVVSDYYQDQEKPSHENSMEKEFIKSSQNDPKCWVKYWGAAGNRAHFRRQLWPNEERVPEIGDSITEVDITAEEAFTILTK